MSVPESPPTAGQDSLLPMYSSAAIANRFLGVAPASGSRLTPMKIQKLVYIAHGWHLAYKDRPLCFETAQAWRWGPVFHDLYHSVKRWGRHPITEEIRDYWDGEVYVVEEDEGGFAVELIDAIWDVYRRFSAAQLSAMTHAKGTPWAAVYKRGKRYAEIPNDLIRSHYRELLRESSGAG